MAKSSNLKAWVVAVDMGYGHQRTAYPLKQIAMTGEVLNANHYQGIPYRDRKIWEITKILYDFISDFKRVPLIGERIFSFFNEFQKILSFYPKRDLSETNFQLAHIFSFIKFGWGKHLIEKLGKKPLPLVTTFFTSAFMAESFNYPDEIFCVVCDADISRTWASRKPGSSKIKYFAPTERVVERLKLYGVKPENIFLTGYPLPLENLGTEKLEILKQDTAHRLLNLDPRKRYCQQYEPLIKKYIHELPQQSNHILTIMFAVGGAGAQKEIGIKIVKSLSKKIKQGRIKVILVAGVREKVKKYFLRKIKSLGLDACLNKGVELIFAQDMEGYFQNFNQALRRTDILWTKPSELSFYTALGLPIILAPCIGSQEDFNKEWLFKLGSAIAQKNPNYTDQWLFDLLNAGWFADAAMQGFIEGKKSGTFNIQKIISLCSG